MGRRSSWLDTTRAMSPPNVPARQRKIRSFRQCPNFETITSSRGLVSSWKAKFIANSSAVELNCCGEVVDIERLLGGERRAQEEDLSDAVVELMVLDDVEVVLQQEARDRLHDPGPFRTGQGQNAQGRCIARR